MNKRNACRKYETHLADALSGSVPVQEMNLLHEHMADCESCQAALESMAADDAFWQKASSFLGKAKSLSTMVKSGEPNHGELTHSTISLRIDEDTRETNTDTDSTPLLDPATHPEMLGRIGAFDVSEIIGRGGMGIVYKGFDTELNRPVAIKVLAPHLAANGISRKRFDREAQAAAAVQHPNVVPIHSVNSTDANSVSPNRPYLVMTLVSGKSLQAHVEEKGPLPAKEVVRIAQQIAAGLAAAHKTGLVHRDIKPANILMENDVNRVMITDFGLARCANDAAVTQTGWLLGTPHYMSPEQVKGNEIDARSDLFSMGAVLYFLCTGREPFRGDQPFTVLQKIVNEEPNDAQSVNNEVPKTLSQIIRRLISKDIEQRFQSAAEVDEVLTCYLAHLQNPRLEPKPKISVAKAKSSSGRVLGLVGLATLLVGFLAVGWWQYIGLQNTAGTNAQPGSTSQNGNVTRSEFNEDSTESNLEWMQGLDSFEQWQSEAEQLDRDIEILEREFKYLDGN